MDFEYLTNIAQKAALAAGNIIQKSMKEAIAVQHKEGGNTLASQVVTAVDLECDQVIRKHLIPTCQKFDLGLLTEETEDDQSRFRKDYFWCVDPLDGTLAYIHKHPGFSVAIALVAKDGTPHIGVVYDPSTENLYHAIKDHGAFKNGKPWKLKTPNNYLTYVTDKKLADTPNKATIEEILKEKYTSLHLKGIQEMAGAGAVCNAILVAEHAPALFVKLPKKEKGGGSIWDFAATACICKELGLPVTNFKGEKLHLNPKETTFLNTQGVYFSS